MSTDRAVTMQGAVLGSFLLTTIEQLATERMRAGRACRAARKALSV